MLCEGADGTGSKTCSAFELISGGSEHSAMEDSNGYLQ